MALPYEIDLDRPPRRVGPRRSSTTWYAAGWAASFGLWVLLLVLAARGLQPLLFLIPALAVTSVMGYSQMRLINDGSLLSQHFAQSGYDPADVSAARRPVDDQELAALRRWHRRAISRIEYERIIAFRHLVHAEITEPEYREILRYLDGQRGALSAAAAISPPADGGVARKD